MITSREDALEFRLEEMIKSSAREAARDGGKFAVALSGGSDSGLMATLTRAENAITVHLPFGEMYDEFKDALATAQAAGVKNHLIVEPQHRDFDQTMARALSLIGRPTRHFSLFPLYKMFERLAQDNFDSVIFGDGPDESMAGYVRCLAMHHLYAAPQTVETFSYYQSLFNKILLPPWEAYTRALDADWETIGPKVKNLMRGKSLIRGMCEVEIQLTRPDVGEICDIFGEHFGIRIIRPYMKGILDEFMLNLPDELKIHDYWGKYLLRRVASRNGVPLQVVWRRRKMGGPVYPVNRLQGWMDQGEFNKGRYFQYQMDILREKRV